ncbi:amidohydrolase family protein [Corynebacterium gerontici]|uniref:amidohydrolase family protein n=1 Tax=Corynebacterium gerontici TaxID=2079234 RepID=UPI00360B5692
MLTEQGFIKGELTIKNGEIASINRSDTQSNELILPGFADVHNHGGAGFSFPTSDQEECAEAARHHLQHGTTTLLASTVSMREPELLPQLGMLAELAQDALIDGIHAEGPFVNACRCGAQDPAAIIEGDPELFNKMLASAKGHLRSITLAPETANVEKLIDACVEHNVIVSFGHTDASYEHTAAAIRYARRRGAKVTATHLFNAMPPLHHRNPGAAAALIEAAARGEATLELIADGVHLADSTVDMMLSTVGAQHITFVSDAMGAAGKADGDYMLGALAVRVRDGVARLRTEGGEEGAIAGGTSRIIDQVQRQLRCDRPLLQVLQAATTGHALLGKPSVLREGAPADVLQCTEELELLQVFKRGQAQRH